MRPTSFHPHALETDRLNLLPVDADLARALTADRKLAGELAHAALHRDFPDTDLADMLPVHADDLKAGRAFVGWGLWLAVYKQVRMVVGSVGFKGPPNPLGEVAIGYGMVAAHRRRGLAVEGTQALVAWALRDSQVGRVLAECRADNIASIRVLEKLGFSRRPHGRDQTDGGPIGWELTRGSGWRRSAV